jgi:glycosyltransferase involved in cell wall biosynthesis
MNETALRSQSTDRDPEHAPMWLVLDTRTAENGVSSGVSRFVVGIAGGLTQVLAGRSTGDIRVLLVGKHEPPAWIIDLVRNYPGLVSYWSGGPGSLTRKSEKPVWLWPSKVVPEIARYTKERFYWVAPGNLDRPLLWPFGRARWKVRLVQVVHDTIPFSQKGSMGFFFRLQFGAIVRRTLAAFPHVVTVSRHSAEALATLVPRRSRPVAVVGNGVEPVFGGGDRPFGKARHDARVRFLQSLFSSAEGSTQQLALVERLARARWVVGVGRYQKYKSWETVEEALPLLQGAFAEGAAFFRVGFCARDQQRLAKCDHLAFGPGMYFPSMGMLGLPELPDASLARLYALADVCVHPSRAEGFGLPPLESAFCGTPVVVRSGTAVDDHFVGSALPQGFVTALDTNDPQGWAQAIAHVCELSEDPRSPLGTFLTGLAKASHCRAIMTHRLGGARFEWTACAERFLDFLFGEQAKVEGTESARALNPSQTVVREVQG